MHKHWNNEAKPLIWWPLARVCLIAETADIVKGALIGRIGGISRCCIGARPVDIGERVVPTHAWDVTCAHVDEDIRRGTDHGIDRGMNLDRRTRENAILDKLRNKYDDLNECEGVYHPWNLPL